MTLLLFAAGLGIAAVWDLRSRRLPNVIVLGLLLLGLILRAVAGGPAAMGAGALGALAGGAALLLPLAMHWVGGGDVKLLAACGMWLGPVRVLEATLAGLVLAGIYGVVLALRNKAVRRDVTTQLMLFASGLPVQAEKRAPS